MAVPALPLWGWNLIIAIQRHEELHGKEDTCLNGVLNAVPADVRLQAAAIGAYVQKARNDELGKRISDHIKWLTDSLFADQSTGSHEEGPPQEDETP
ncbi:hypothetical protein [Streptomyces venezuelae]|uniref:Uncharacterized protein n=1 Tax=Streptomyces venezuelae TaxID=54571 RepID=A0A5P2B5Q7_STRVZ|nr:hypothetical protein [Streptomyces venezuelae]QES25825.1 hypothetical protein DEJ47_04595 [Streptomyces venezuelae]